MTDEGASISTLLWLGVFPAALAVHFLDEYFVGEGYPAYLYRVRGVSIGRRRFVGLYILGFLLLSAGCIAAYALSFPQFMTCLLGAFLFSNGLSHTLTALRHGFGPGLLSSVLLWLPVGALTLFVLWHEISFSRWMMATSIGFAINGLIALITLRGGRIARPTSGFSQADTPESSGLT